MEIGEMHLLFIISKSLMLGICIGFVMTILLIKKENKNEKLIKNMIEYDKKKKTK